MVFICRYALRSGLLVSKKKVLQLVTLSLIHFFSCAQSNTYQPLRNYASSKQKIEYVAGNFKLLSKDLQLEDKRIRKIVDETGKELSSHMLDLHNASLLMYSDSLTGYVREILNRIKSGNSDLASREFELFTLRSEDGNASNRGKGVVFINLGLIGRLRTEGELAFVICHELAHDQLNHVSKGVKERAELYYDPTFQKKLKNILSEQYNRAHRIEALLTQYIGKYTEHNRENELAADSLGLIYFMQAGYNAMEAVNCIQKLDSIDHYFYENVISYETYFNFPSFPFKREWLTQEEVDDFGGGQKKEGLPDSLKTHPACSVRTKALEKVINKRPVNESSIWKANLYDGYSKVARLEEVELYLQSEQFGKSLYFALLLLREYPRNSYLEGVVFNSLYEIYIARKHHYFSSVVENPSNSMPNSYKTFISFLHNLSLDELRKLTTGYYATRMQDERSTGYNYYLYILHESIAMDPNSFASLLTTYQQQNKDLYYGSLINSKFNPKHKN